MEGGLKRKSSLGPQSADEAEIFAIEVLRADLQHAIHQAMKRHRVSRKALARLLGCSPKNVSQLLSEDGNPTIETVARVFHALNDAVSITHGPSRILRRRAQGRRMTGEAGLSQERAA